MGGKQERCDGHEVSPVPGGCSNPCWRPRCIRMYEWATYRLIRYELVGEGTVRRVVCRNEIGYKDVSGKHITRCHDRNVDTCLVRTTIWEGRSCELCNRYHVYRQHPTMCLQWRLG